MTFGGWSKESLEAVERWAKDQAIAAAYARLAGGLRDLGADELAEAVELRRDEADAVLCGEPCLPVGEMQAKCLLPPDHDGPHRVVTQIKTGRVTVEWDADAIARLRRGKP